MAHDKKKAQVKALDKKAMKSTKGGGGLIIDRHALPPVDSDARKAGGTGNPY